MKKDEALEKALDKAIDQIGLIENSMNESNRLVKEYKKLFPNDTLEQERKNKIAANLVHNLTEEELIKLETFAKEQFRKPGIIYKEVLD